MLYRSIGVVRWVQPAHNGSLTWMIRPVELPREAGTDPRQRKVAGLPEYDPPPVLPMERRRTRRQARDLVEAENQWSRLVFHWLFSVRTRIAVFPSTRTIGLSLMRSVVQGGHALDELL
jgi:hypothetical protein